MPKHNQKNLTQSNNSLSGQVLVKEGSGDSKMLPKLPRQYSTSCLEEIEMSPMGINKPKNKRRSTPRSRKSSVTSKRRNSTYYE
jgi:hypothetical protein